MPLILFILLVMLKFSGNVDWSWWVVTCPVWGCMLSTTIAMALGVHKK